MKTKRPFLTNPSEFSDVLISDFTEPLFQNAFKNCFSELGIDINDWNDLFREMNNEGANKAFIRLTKDG